MDAFKYFPNFLQERLSFNNNGEELLFGPEMTFLCKRSRSEEGRGVSPGHLLCLPRRGSRRPLPGGTHGSPEGLRPYAWTLPSGSPDLGHRAPPGEKPRRQEPLTYRIWGAERAGCAAESARAKRRAPTAARPAARSARGARRSGRGLRSCRAPRPIPARPGPAPGSPRSSAPCV